MNLGWPKRSARRERNGSAPKISCRSRKEKEQGRAKKTKASRSEFNPLERFASQLLARWSGVLWLQEDAEERAGSNECSVVMLPSQGRPVEGTTMGGTLLDILGHVAFRTPSSPSAPTRELSR